MRPILIIAATAAFCLVLWHALVVVAPEIEARIDAAAEAAVAEGEPHPIGIATRGRTVRVAGLADSDDSRDALIARIAALPGVILVEDRIEVLPHRAPYAFTAERHQGHPLAVSGHVPSVAAEAAVLDAARRIATGTLVESALEIAAGSPGPDWIDDVRTGLDALGHLVEGRVEITDRDGSLRGRAGSEAAREAAIDLLATHHGIAWRTEIDLILPVAAPYSFVAEKTADGVAHVAGHAPDEATRTMLSEAAAALAPETTARIALARGMPARDWPGRVLRGIEALGTLDEGQLQVEGLDVTLTGVAATPEARAEAERRAGAGAVLALTVATPTPAARLEIAVTDGAATLVAARLPSSLDASGLLEALPEVSRGDATIETGGRESDAAWGDALAVLAIALPRLLTGRATLEDDRLSIRGTLRDGFSAATTRTALRSAAGGLWTLDLDFDEAPQAAALVIEATEAGVVLSGILPDGMTPEVALVRFGGAESGGVTSGGAGDALDWRTAIDALAALRDAYRTMTARIDAGVVTVEGELAPGQRLDELGAWLAGRLEPAWNVALSGVERAARDGETRVNVALARRERLSFGHWLPVLTVEPTPGGCARATAIAEGAISFVAGKAEIAPESKGTLDTAAAIALVCTVEAGLVLEIGGHTDADGAEEANIALSTRRAEAVRDALAARGVEAERLVATGHGSSIPVGDNATEDGRRQNRRITLDWRVAPRDLPPAPEEEPGEETLAGIDPAASDGAPSSPESAAASQRPTPTGEAAPETTAIVTTAAIASPPAADTGTADGPSPGAAPLPPKRPDAALLAPAPPASEITQ